MAVMKAAPEESTIVLDTVPEGYARFDHECRLTFINQAAEKLLHLPQDKEEDAHALLAGVCRRALAEQAPISSDHFCERLQRWFSIAAIPDKRGGVVARLSDVTNTKQVEIALQRSEEMFCKVFRSSPIPLSIIDFERDDTFIDINEAFASVTGYTRSEVLGRSPKGVGLEVDSQSEERSQFLRQNGEYRNREIKVRRKDGEILTCLLSASRIQMDGKPLAIAAALDITTRRRAEEALRESEELYRQIFDVESEALVLVDHESGQLLGANAAASKLYGYTREELLALKRTDLSAEPAETIASAKRMQTFIPLRWHRKKDGTVFPVEISGSYFELKGRNVYVSAIRDITERRRMAEALNKSEEKFAKAFQSNPAAIVIADLGNRKLLEVNQSFEEITGYRREEVVGQSWDKMDYWVNPSERDRAIALLLEKGSLRHGEFAFRKKSGEIYRGLLSAECIELDNSPCAIATVVDVSAQLQLENQLRQAQKLESVGRLAGGIAHDFNNLLTIINGYSEFILNSTKPGDTVYPYAQEIRKAGEHAAGLTNQLLAFSRKQVIEPRALDLNTVVSDAKRMLHRLIGEDIQLTTLLEPDLPPVMADPGQIQQVIINLAVNARDAMPEGGMLSISTGTMEVDSSMAAACPDAVPGSYVTMTITDTGVGMDGATLQNAFEPFFTTKETGRGTGLGLSTVYGIVHQNAGWIKVRSEVGRGTSFTVCLPGVDAATIRERAVAKKKCMAPTGETVLLVEDDNDVRHLTRALLENLGYHVLEAAGSAGAFVVEKEFPGTVHLLLTDVILQGMNGKTLSDQLRARRPDLRVLFTSGYTAEVISRRGILDPEVAYLPKPFTLESLAAKVREALKGPIVSKSGGTGQ